MLFTNATLVCALLSTVYELYTRTQITWCGICATFRGFDVSHRRIASVIYHCLSGFLFDCKRVPISCGGTI